MLVSSWLSFSNLYQKITQLLLEDSAQMFCKAIFDPPSPSTPKKPPQAPAAPVHHSITQLHLSASLALLLDMGLSRQGFPWAPLPCPRSGMGRVFNQQCMSKRIVLRVPERTRELTRPTSGWLSFSIN